MVQKIHPWGVIWVPSIPPMLSTCQKTKWRHSCPVWRCPWLGLQLHTALLYVHVPLSRIKYVLHTIFFKSSICTTCKMVSQLTARNASYLCERKALHNITLLYEHLCKKQVMTPSIVHWLISSSSKVWETHFNGQKNRPLVL